MKSKFFLRLFALLLIFLVSAYIYKKSFYKKQKIESKNKTEETQILSNNSNIIDNVKYISKDINGNKYIITAKEGEIDLENENIIFLKDVKSFITLKNSENVDISSDFGKYNIINYDTILTKNVIVRYLDNEIKSEYLDFSFGRNSLIVSNNVVYSNNDNILKSDVIELNIQTKDTKIFMHEKNKQVNIKSKN